MKQSIINSFTNEVEKKFSFLVEKYDFSKPKIEFNKKISYLMSIYFLGKNIGIELALDAREGDEHVSCYIFKVIDDNKPSAWEFDKKGVRVRDYFTAYLTRRGERGHYACLSNISNLDFQKQIPVVLSDYVRMLEEYGQDILCDKPLSL